MARHEDQKSKKKPEEGRRQGVRCPSLPPMTTRTTRTTTRSKPKGRQQEGGRRVVADCGRTAEGHARRIRHPGHRRAVQDGRLPRARPPSSSCRRKANGQYLSVAEVSEAADQLPRRGKREAHDQFPRESERGRGRRPGTRGAGRSRSRARTVARRLRDSTSPEPATKVTKERAYAQMLEDAPGGIRGVIARSTTPKRLIATLEAAGVRLAR